MRRLYIALALLALAAPARAQLSSIFISTVANLPASCTGGQPFIVTDGNAADDCSTGGGSTAVLCTCDSGGSTYSATGDGGGGGSGDVTDVGPGCATGACLTDGVATSGTTMFVWEGTGVDANELTIAVASANPGADYTITVPEETGTIITTALKRDFSFNCKNCKAADSGDLQKRLPNASTLTRVSCTTSAGTATIALYERTEALPNTGVTNLMTSTLVCDNNGESTTSFSDSAIAAGALVVLGITAETLGNNDWVRAYVEYTVD